MLRKLALFALAASLAWPALAATPVNINKADANAIAEALDGIGPSKAAAIVAWRDEHGPFKSVDDLSQIKGLGAATLERNRTAILLADGPGAAATEAATAAPAKKKKSAKSAARTGGE